MNDDSITLQPSDDTSVDSSSSDKTESTPVSSSVHVFDITSDLNIEPARADDDTTYSGPIDAASITVVDPRLNHTEQAMQSHVVPTPPVPTRQEDAHPVSPIIPDADRESVAGWASLAAVSPAVSPLVHPLDPHTVAKDPNISETIPQPVVPPIVPLPPIIPVISPVPTPGIHPPRPSSQAVPANPPAKTIHLVENTDPWQAGSRLSGNLQKDVLGILPGGIEQPGKAKGPIDPNIKPMRTYESDVADVMSRKHISTAHIVIAEKEKNKEAEPAPVMVRPQMEPRAPSHILRNLFFVFVSLALLAGGSYGAYYLYSNSLLVTSRGTPAPSTPTPDSPQLPAGIVPADSQVLVAANTSDPARLRTIVVKEISKSQPSNTIKEIILTNTVQGQTLRITAPDALKMSGIHPPDTLIRSLNDSWMLGSYTNKSGVESIFIVATNSFFQNAFAGMLAWENGMAGDLKPFLPDEDLTTVGSSTSYQSFTTVNGHFIDKIVKNHDVREFVGNDDRLYFLYSFIDNQKLVITSSEEALAEIISRLDRQGYIR